MSIGNIITALGNSDNTREDDIFLYGIFTGDHRHDITSNLECLGVVRPIHAECNSRVNLYWRYTVLLNSILHKIS